MSTISQTELPLPRTPPLPKEDPFRLGWRYVTARGADGQMAQRQVPLTMEDVLHPQEGDFIVNNPLHQRLAGYLEQGTRWRFAGRDDVAVLADNRIAWEAPEAWAHAPDLGLFTGIKKPWGDRKTSYVIAEMGGVAEWMIEITSPTTRNVDFGPKLREYFLVGVKRYAILDVPDADEPGPINLFGYKAGARQFEPIQLDPKGRLWLDVIDLWLGTEGLAIYLEDRDGVKVRGYEELARAARGIEEEIAAKRAQLAQAQSRIQELEAEIARLKSPPK